MSPTFNALNRLAQGFQIDLADLLEETSSERATGVAVTRANEKLGHATSKYHWRAMTSGATGRTPFNVVEFAIEAKDINEFDKWDSHYDNNFVYVLKGPIQFHQETAKGPITLETGDSIYFDARIGHAFTAAEDGPGRALSVTSPQ